MALSQPRSTYRIDEGPAANVKARHQDEDDDISDNEMDAEDIHDDAGAQQHVRPPSRAQRVQRRTSSFMSKLVRPAAHSLPA